MKEYYECHITMIGNPTEVQKAIELWGWKFSAIDGDPDLGTGVKCYATAQYNRKYTLEQIVEGMKEKAAWISKFSGAEILRKKVEVVVFDERE